MEYLSSLSTISCFSYKTSDKYDDNDSQMDHNNAIERLKISHLEIEFHRF